MAMRVPTVVDPSSSDPAMAATAASFSGWTFIGHPVLIWRDGLSYAFASFYVLTIPITGTFFSKRTWLMGKRYGFITPGDMYAYYYNNETLRWLVVATAVLLGVVASVLGALLPALRASSIQPVLAMRARR